MIQNIAQFGSDVCKRCLRPTRGQLDVVKFQGISSSILLAG